MQSTDFPESYFVRRRLKEQIEGKPEQVSYDPTGVGIMLKKQSTEVFMNDLIASIAQALESVYQIEGRLFSVLTPNAEEKTVNGSYETLENEPQRLNEKLQIAISKINRMNNKLQNIISRVEL